VLDRLVQAYQRRRDRKLWRGVCAELGIAYAEPVAAGTIDGLRVELDIQARRMRITTGLPPALAFARRDGETDAKFGDVWVDGSVVLRGDVTVWLRVLDRDMRTSLDDLVRLSAASLQDGTLELRESLRATVTPTVVDRVAPIRAAVALAKALVAAAANTDDSVLFAACKQGSQRDRLTAVMLVRTQRASDPRTAALLAELEADRAPEVQMLVALSAARWPKVAALAKDTRCDARVLAETVATLRALYPKLESLPELAALRDQPDARGPLATALDAMCRALSAG
jgi:hypothetical protein